MDCYDTIELVSARSADLPGELLADTARRVADLWNDPPRGCWQSMQVREAFPELADALDELLGGGPVCQDNEVTVRDGIAYRGGKAFGSTVERGNRPKPEA